MFNIASPMSFGASGSSINAMTTVEPLVAGLTRGLFVADLEHHWQSLLDYDVPQAVVKYRGTFMRCDDVMCQVCPPRPTRRRLLGGLAAASMLPSLRAFAADPAPADAPNAISGDAALHRLMEGNARYASNRADTRDFDAGRVARSKAQYPIAAILGCADSRVGPEFVFDQGPGELFVVRVAGNVLTDSGAASLEYATQVLGVPLILVLGHSNCGAVAAAIKSAEGATTLPGHLPELIARIAPAVTATRSVPAADRLSAAITENVRLTERQTSTTAPLLSTMVASGKIKVAGGVYDLASGKVQLI